MVETDEDELYVRSPSSSSEDGDDAPPIEGVNDFDEDFLYGRSPPKSKSIGSKDGAGLLGKGDGSGPDGTTNDVDGSAGDDVKPVRMNSKEYPSWQAAVRAEGVSEGRPKATVSKALLKAMAEKDAIRSRPRKPPAERRMSMMPELPSYGIPINMLCCNGTRGDGRKDARV